MIIQFTYQIDLSFAIFQRFLALYNDRLLDGLIQTK